MADPLDHALAKRLDDFGRSDAKLVTVPSELLREVAFELREQAKQIASMRERHNRDLRDAEQDARAAYTEGQWDERVRHEREDW